MVIVRQSPPTSAIYRASLGEQAVWGLPEQLLAEIADRLAIANWQRSEGKARDFPKPIARPGVEGPRETTTLGDGALSLEEMDAWLGWNVGPVAEIDRAMDDLDDN